MLVDANSVSGYVAFFDKVYRRLSRKASSDVRDQLREGYVWMATNRYGAIPSYDSFFQATNEFGANKWAVITTGTYIDNILSRLEASSDPDRLLKLRAFSNNLEAVEYVVIGQPRSVAAVPCIFEEGYGVYTGQSHRWSSSRDARHEFDISGPIRTQRRPP